MPAPENLQAQTPGEPLSTANAPAADQSPDKVVFHPKHLGGGHWVVVDNDGARVGAFQGDKEAVVAEIERLAEGGEPVAFEVAPQPAAKVRTGNLDPYTLKQSVLTPDGWLCPAPKPETN